MILSLTRGGARLTVALLVDIAVGDEHDAAKHVARVHAAVGGRGRVERHDVMHDRVDLSPDCGGELVRPDACQFRSGNGVEAQRSEGDRALERAQDRQAEVRGGCPPTTPTATSRPFGASRSINDGRPGPPTMSMITSNTSGADSSPAPARSSTCVAPSDRRRFPRSADEVVTPTAPAPAREAVTAAMPMLPAAPRTEHGLARRAGARARTRSARPGPRCRA